MKKKNDRKSPASARLPGRWLGYLGIVVALAVGLHLWRTSPLAAGEAPELAGTLVGPGRFDLDDHRGKPVLVHFWATWCPLCRLGDEAIDAVAEDYEVITVAMQSGSDSEIETYLIQEALGFRVLSDPYGEIASRWGVTAVPTSFMLDGNGRIVFSTVGYTMEMGLRGRLWTIAALE